MDDEIHILMNDINNLLKSFISMSSIHVYTNHLIMAQHSFIYLHTTIKYLLYTGQCIRCYVYSEEQDSVPKELALEVHEKKKFGIHCGK